MKENDGLLPCSRECMREEKNCNVSDCRHFINFKDEYNCTLVAIYENGPMTLREIGDRLGISFARVKQIETQALKKIKNSSLNSFLN
jgi:DNA-binding MarR family transcriptional regulator